MELGMSVGQPIHRLDAPEVIARGFMRKTNCSRPDSLLRIGGSPATSWIAAATGARGDLAVMLHTHH